MDTETRQHWTEPGPHEMAPGVFRIPLPLPTDGLRAVNVYAVLTETGVVLVDGGWAIAEAEERLTASLRKLDREVGDVSDVFVTHFHRDHYTLAVTLRRKWGSRIGVGEPERVNLEPLANRPQRTGTSLIRMLRRAGADRLAEVIRELQKPVDPSEWELPDDWIADGTEIDVPGRHRLRAIHTPGHTAGHMVFVDAELGVLFAGDHVLPHITPSIGFEHVHQPSPLRDYLTSLALMRDLPDARLLPAHGPSAPSVHERVDELLEHHEDRLDAILKAITQGETTAFEIASRLRWTRRDRTLAELDAFNQSLATVETMAHLEVLVERGLATRRDDDGVVRYEV